jgi:hypothetical protein
MRRAPAPLSSLILILTLASCAAARDYPSLERRPAELGGPERQTGSAQPVTGEATATPPPPLSSELTTRLAQLVDVARGAHQRFGAKHGAAERSVASAGRAAMGSEGWSVATVALSELESVRSDAMFALAELDQLYTSEVIAASQNGNATTIDAIAASRDQVTALIAEEDQVLARLRGRMGG